MTTEKVSDKKQDPKRFPWVEHDDLCVWWDNVGKEPLDYACTCGKWAEHLDALVVALDEANRELASRRALDEGTVRVPREPTKEMIAAGSDEHDNCIDTGFGSNSDGDRFEYTTISPDAPYRIYRAMIAAYEKGDAP